MGVEAEHASEWAEGMQDRYELQCMMGFHGAAEMKRSLCIRSEPTEKEKEDAREKARQIYAVNKAAKVGTELVCACCQKKFVKRSYQQAFCQRNKKKRGSSCKDVYHNVTNETRRQRAQPYLERKLNANK